LHAIIARVHNGIVHGLLDVSASELLNRCDDVGATAITQTVRTYGQQIIDINRMHCSAVVLIHSNSVYGVDRTNWFRTFAIENRVASCRVRVVAG